MSALTARPKTAEDDEWIIAIRNRINDHLPPTSLASFRHWERVDRVSEKAHVERFVVERGGDRVSSFFLEKMWWTEKEGGYFGGISVDPSMWGQGIGTWVYDRLMERLVDLRAERVYGSIRNDRPRAQGFADRRGFRKTGHADRWSRLDVRWANMDGYVGLEKQLANDGIEIRTLAEVGDSEDFLRKLHAAQDEAVADIPMSEPYVGSPFEQFLEELKEPNLSPDRFWIALHDGEPVGVAALPIEESGAGFNGFTGVRRAYRGKGIARALKCKTVEWAKANDVEFIFTANDVHNKRMLAINNSLGYCELPISEEVVKPLGSLHSC